MNFYTIPAKLSFQNELDSPVSIQLLFSKKIYDLFKNFNDWEYVYKDYQDLSLTDASAIVNRDVGDDLLTHKLTVYTQITDAQLPASNYATALNELAMMNIRPVLINRNNSPTALKSVNNIDFYTGSARLNGISSVTLGYNNFYADNNIRTASSFGHINTRGDGVASITFYVYNPDDISTDVWKSTSVGYVRVRISCTFSVSGSSYVISRIIILGGKDPSFNTANFRNYFLVNFNGNGDGTGAHDDDTSNPYADPGNSGPGGGDGDYEDPNQVDPTDVPDAPDIDSASTGLFTIYNPTGAQLRSLASFLWSGAFDPDSFKKLFADPMQCLIGLAIVPCVPASQGTKNIKFGNVDSGVSASYLSSQFVKVDCGSVQIKKQIGSFLDYSPYTKINVFLPYIGFRELSADDLMPGSINVQYIVDVVTGACAAFIKHSVKGVLYSYNGSCITNLALTGANYSQAIQNAVSTVASGVGVVAGMATGNAPITAMSAAGLLGNACNTAINSKPSIQRSGNMGGSAGIMSVQKPYIIIERTNMSVPAEVQHYVGQTSNITAALGDLSGFTMVEHIHLHNVPATSEEIKEIEDMLKKGVIL